MASPDCNEVESIADVLKQASRSKVPTNYGNAFPLPSQHFARVLKNIYEAHPDGPAIVQAVLDDKLPNVGYCHHAGCGSERSQFLIFNLINSSTLYLGSDHSQSTGVSPRQQPSILLQSCAAVHLRFGLQLHWRSESQH